MGAGGRMSESSVRRRVPHSKPPFTLGDLKKAVPPHCFQRSILRSFSYLVSDLIIVSLLCYIATNGIPLLPHHLSYLAWPFYWFVQGCFVFGIWILGHECGHHAFSDYQWLDDSVGLVIHSALLTPYFSWKISHRHHHSNTASLDYDETYVPHFKPKQESFYWYIYNRPGRALILTYKLTLGWYSYLIFNIAGRNYDRFACHFDPQSPIYSDRERNQIIISDAGVLACTYGLYRLAAVKGIAWVLCVYGGPLLVMNGFLVLVTCLQHTHKSLPHYDSSEWDWLRGALSTVDRDYGILNKVFHHLPDTHVIHHLFSMMPHYHAMEATTAIKPLLGDYYHFDGTPYYKAMWRDIQECLYIEPDEGEQNKGVYWFRSKTTF